MNISIMIGLLTAFATLMMTNRTMEGFDHPDPDYRLLLCLNKLDLDDEHELWWIAGWFLLQWQVEYRNHLLDIPSTTGSKRLSFMALYSNLQNWKNREKF